MNLGDKGISGKEAGFCRDFAIFVNTSRNDFRLFHLSLTLLMIFS